MQPNDLSSAGCPPGKYDGIVGPNTIEAVRLLFNAGSADPDGYARLTFVARLRSLISVGNNCRQSPPAALRHCAP